MHCANVVFVSYPEEKMFLNLLGVLISCSQSSFRIPSQKLRREEAHGEIIVKRNVNWLLLHDFRPTLSSSDYQYTPFS